MAKLGECFHVNEVVTLIFSESLTEKATKLVGFCEQYISGVRTCEEVISAHNEIGRKIVHMENSIVNLISSNLCNGAVCTLTFTISYRER